MKRPYSFFTQYVQPINAITYYRNLSPLSTLVEQGKVQLIEDDFNPATRPERRNKLLSSADFAWSHCVPACQLWRNYGHMQDMAPIYMPFVRTQVKYPPVWAIDVDDTYDWVSPTNPAFATWGVRDLEGNVMPAGGQLYAHLKSGETKIIFEDGKLVEGNKDGIIFDLKENFKRVAKFKTVVQQARVITVTTPELREHLIKTCKPREIIIYPNCLRKSDFPSRDLVPHKDVRVVWQGGSSHADDWNSVWDAMKVCAKRFPDVTWIFYGQEYKYVNGLFKKREEIHWKDFSAHALQLHCIDADINLIPLLPNNFTIGKSAIKWYEASALKRPMASIARAAAPYTEIEDGKTGMLYHNNHDFVEKLGKLITDATLRRELAENAKKWVWANRDVEKEAPKLLEQLVDVRERYIKEKGDVRELFGASEDLDPEPADAIPS